MRLSHLRIASLVFVLGCDSERDSAGAYTMLQTAEGAIILLDTRTGETSRLPQSTFRALEQGGMYTAEDGATYRYVGNGVLQQLTHQEVIDYLVDIYAGEDP